MKIRPLVEGALFAAVSVVLGLAGYFLPAIGLVVMFFWPVPVALVYIRHEARTAFLTVVVTGLVLSLVIGALQALFIVLISGSLGLALGFAYHRRFSGTATLLLMVGAALFATVASAVLSYYLLGISLYQTMDQLFEETIKGLTLYEKIGLQPEMVQAMRDHLLQAKATVPLLIPSGLLVSAFFLAYLNLAAATPVLQRFGFQLPGLPPFRQWRMPRLFALLYILGFVLLLAGPYLKLPWLAQAGTNLIFFLSLAFSLQGMAVAYYFFERWKLSKPFRVGLLIYLLLVPITLQIITWLGLFDTLLDYRRMAEERDRRG